MKCYGYIRVSSFTQIDNTSPEWQEKQINALAAKHDLVVDEWINNLAVTGTKPFYERPGVADIDFQAGDVLLVAKIDRLSRTQLDILQVIDDFKKSDITLITGDFGKLTDPEDQMAALLVSVMSMFIEWERKNLVERTAEGRAEKKAKGLYSTRSDCKWGQFVDDDQVFDHGYRALAIDRMVEMRLEGASYREIQKDIIERYSCGRNKVKLSLRTLGNILNGYKDEDAA